MTNNEVINEGEDLPEEGIEGTYDDIDPSEIAIAAMQGMLARGIEPAVAAQEAWMTCVPNFYAGRDNYIIMVEKMNAAFAPKPE